MGPDTVLHPRAGFTPVLSGGGEGTGSEEGPKIVTLKGPMGAKRRGSGCRGELGPRPARSPHRKPCRGSWPRKRPFPNLCFCPGGAGGEMALLGNPCRPTVVAALFPNPTWAQGLGLTCPHKSCSGKLVRVGTLRTQTRGGDGQGWSRVAPSPVPQRQRLAPEGRGHLPVPGLDLSEGCRGLSWV